MLTETNTRFLLFIFLLSTINSSGDHCVWLKCSRAEQKLPKKSVFLALVSDRCLGSHGFSYWLEKDQRKKGRFFWMFRLQCSLYIHIARNLQTTSYPLCSKYRDFSYLHKFLVLIWGQKISLQSHANKYDSYQNSNVYLHRYKIEKSN